MKQKNFVVEVYQAEDKTTYIVRVPGDNNQWVAELITTNPGELADFFGKIVF